MQFVEVLKKSFAARNRRGGRKMSPIASFDALEPRLLLSAVTMTDNEQLMLELINRGRSNPTAEASRHGIGLNDGLAAGTISTAAKQPLAAHQGLIDAGGVHAVDMLNRDYFSHTTLGSSDGASERAQTAGYPSSSVGENIAWGGTTGVLDQVQAVYDRHHGLFLSTGHRTNMMHIPYEEIGVGIRYGLYTSNGTDYNAAMAVIDFGIRNVNPFITGVVFTDGNSDDFYDVGEAIRNGKVTATNLTTGTAYFESIGNSGGYGIPVPAGSYSVTASYTVSGVPRLSSRNVTVGTDNVKLDFDSTDLSDVTLTLTSTLTALNETGASAKTTIQVTRNGDTSSAITVNLSSSDTTAITVPASVLIPAGQTAVTFDVNAVNDTVIDGTQTARVTATAALYAAGTISLTVADRTSPLLPNFEQTVATSRPTFTWTGVSNAATYQVYVNNVTTGDNAVINQSGITATSLISPISLPIGKFNVWVRGFTATGLASVWSPATVWKVRPTTTVLNSGRTESSATFTIEWAALTGASSYDVWVDRLTPKTVQYLRNTNVAGTSLQVSNFAIGKYAVWVRARNSAGDLVNWSPQAIINVNVAPTGVNVTAPELAGTPTLNWNSVAGATAFDVWVDRLNPATAQVVRNTSVSGNSLAMPSLGAGSYRAWVRAKDLNAVTYAWSRYFDFQVQTAPRLLTPSGSGQSVRPLFTWTQVSGATRYELVIADTALVPIITESNLTGTSFVPAVDLPAGAYRAWMRVFDGAGNSSIQSATMSFTVSFNSPLLQSPADDMSLEFAFASIEEWLMELGTDVGQSEQTMEMTVTRVTDGVEYAPVVPEGIISDAAETAHSLQTPACSDEDNLLSENLITASVLQDRVADTRDGNRKRRAQA